MYAGKLGYTVPSLMNVMKVSFDNFDGSYLPNGLGVGIKFQLAVQNFDDNTQLFCPSDLCQLNFKRDYTPYLLDTIPSNVYKGQLISFQMNVKNAHNPEATPITEMPFREVRIDDDCVDYQSLIDDVSPESFRIPGWTNSQFQAYVGSQNPNKLSQPNILFYGGYQINMRSSQHCNFAGDDCWTIRTHPMISNLSQNNGYTTGGQLLTISGFGLNGTNVRVMIDGQPCKIQESQSNQITCITSATQFQSKLGYQPGQTGLTRIKKNINDGISYKKLSNIDYPTVEFNLSTSFEEQNVNIYANDMRQLSGWFTAPATGNYRFYISCDDICQLLIDDKNPFVPGSPSTTSPSPTLIASRKSWTSWRNYFYPNSATDQHISDWISLQQGQSYYILGQTGNYQGGEHFTVSVEVQTTQTNSNSTTSNSSIIHPKASKTVQQLAMDTQNTQEQWSITIQNPDSGSFMINLVVPKSSPPTTWQSAAVPNLASAIQIQNILQPYYTKYFNSLISVALTMYDSSQTVTNDSTLAKTYSYSITLLRQINGFSSTAATITNVGKTNSTFSVIPPNKGIQSSPPVNGTYVIKCTDSNGDQWSTTDIQYNTAPIWIEYIITSSIPFLIDKTKIIADNRYLYAENGLSFMLKFDGLDYDVPQCTLDYGTGKYPLTGSTLTPNCTTLQHYGSSLIFEPVPLEFLTSDAQSPQVIITVDDLPALCANLNCDYTYQTPTSNIQSQSLSTTGVLQLSGVNIPQLDQSQINFGPTSCTLISQDVSSVSCNLTDSVVTGSWIVQIISQFGIIPNSISTPIEIPAFISSIAPNTGINSLGGDILVISGNNFGYDPSVVKITFTDGTTCSVLAVNMVSISCKVNRFTTTINSPVQVTVSINNVTDSSQSIVLDPNVSSAMTLVPNSVSPVLKSDLTIYLGQEYTFPLQTSDFTVTLLNPSNASYSKNLFVMSVNQTSNSVQFKFPGAHSGNYTIQISSIQCGRLLSDSLALWVHGTVTNVSPNSGSLYGGTLITITGENFSNDPQDNPVQIGSDYCYILTTNATQITCRTDLLTNQIASTELLLVFLKTSEEAEFTDMSQQSFQYIIPNAAISAATVIFNQTTLTLQVILTGTGFDSSIQLVLDGFEQQLNQQNDTTAVFDVINVLDIYTTDIQVFTSQGYPSGMENIVELSFTQSLLSISPATGSSGGTWITVQGSGFGVNTIGLNIQDQTKNSNMCSQVVIQSYGLLQCLTLPYSITASTTFTLTVNSTVQQGQYVSQNLSYQQTEIISVTSIQLNQNAITFIGSGFNLVDTEAKASFAGVNATSITVNSDNTLVANWDSTGIAPVTQAVSPVLWFQSQSNPVIIYFAVIPQSIAINKTLSITSTTSGLSCSFAGGCTYAIEASGLTAALMNSSNSVTICSNVCQLRLDLSDSNSAVCQIPSLATTFSVKEYTISKSQTLNETIFASNQSGAVVLNDQNVQNDYVDPATSGCYFGMQFKQGYVGILDQSQIFLNKVTNTTPFADKLSFQGSNDGVTYTTLHTFDKSIHEGWNYIIYDDESEKPAFNQYRFFGTQSGSCRVTEFRLIGVQAIQDTQSTYSCQPEITFGKSLLDVASTYVNPITYSQQLTPLLESIEPRFGSVLGNTKVTLTGQNLQGASFTNVTFDNRVCHIQSQNQTQIVCITSDKPYVSDSPQVNIYIDGFGNVATQGLLFYYVSLWSSTQTWGGDIPPLEGESVSIPKGQHLLVDVDTTPVLFAIIVEGSLIFAPDVSDSNHLRTFDANYIMIQGGYMEVGTEQFPYTSKIIITMHGDRYSPYLPMYGNKVIANRFGILDMHGVARNITWTRLAQTANVGDTQIVLLEHTDWAVGEEIVIAPTDFSNDQAETRIITAVEAGIHGTIVSFTDPILYKHISLVPEYDGIKVPMQAEVGLLTRNVVYRGDPETSAINQYGAHIMISSPGDESCIGRLEWIELKDVGQAYKLGRYPIHYHMIGTVMSSYVQGNSIHQTYNRAVTAHHVHYLRILNNVAFDTMGHTFFIEDAIETHNYYNHNLAIQVKKSTALLNTDQTPGGFWITHPNNIFTNNAIAGSDAYGFWFDLQDHSTGPSYDINICPTNERLGAFSNNSAHSVHKYGLRIFHVLKPQTYPCLESPYDGNYLQNNQTDPYWQNPRIEALFENHLSWKCERNGAITDRTGFVTFRNFTIADSFIAGIEFSKIEDIVDGYATVQGGIVVGNTFLNDDSQYLAQTTSWGLIGPRTENFTVFDLRFYNFNFSESAALGTCSHCYHPAATDSGGRTFKVQNLTFDSSTVPRRIRYQIPFREIIHDLDGSLTGLGPNTWATSYWTHNLQPECQNSSDVHNGIICDSSVQVRRVAFHQAQPAALQMIKLKIAQWDLDYESQIKQDNQTLYDFQQDVDQKYFSRVEQRAKLDPLESWSIPFVTGHRYRFHWGEGIDFTQIRVTPSNRWDVNDKYLYLMTNFTDVRASINITLLDAKKTQIANETFLQSADLLQTGDNVIYNQTSVREFNFVINGKNTTGRSDFYIKGYRCVVNCNQAAIEEVKINTTQIYWSQPSSWPKGVLPVAGEDVEILPGVNMVLDIETPILNQLTVNGRLTFLNNATHPLNLTLHAKILYVRQGQLIIGNQSNPYNGIAMIKLYGSPNDITLAYSLSIMGGNKILAVLGSAQFYGQPRDRISRLRATANLGDQKILVQPGLDWTSGDRIALAPTATQNLHTDYGVVSSYNYQTGEVELTKPLNFYHWGAPTSTGSQYNGLDMRGEVILLTRNVKVVGNDSDSWGGQIVVSDNIESTGVIRSGQITFDNVEIYNCSQRDTYNSAIRIEGANNLTQTFTNSAISGSLAWSFSSQGSSNVNVQNSSFVGSRQAGLVVMSSFNITVNNSFVGDVISRPEIKASNMLDKEACISMCAWNENDYCTDITLTNTIAAGCVYAGVIAQGHDCGASATQINNRNNVAHSVYGSGAFIFQNQSNPDHVNCYEGSYFSAYKCSDMGIATFFAVQETRMSHMTLVDNTLGVQILTGYNQADTSNKTLSVLQDSIIFGESQAEDCPQNANCYCKDKNAFLLFTNAIAGKKKHITAPSMFPLYKIKSYGTWKSAASMNNITFKNFAQKKTACGARQVIFAISGYSTDYVPLHQFTKTTFNNVSDDAIAYFIAPFPWWNDPAKCVAFPCTAPSNVVLTFESTTFSGETLPSLLNPSFQIVSNTDGASENLNSCTFKNSWNAWQCKNDYLGVLLAQGLDDDWEDRTVSPVYVTNDNSNFTNIINSFFDHTWDGPYSAQKHKTQFPSFIQTTGNYTITYTGTPFKSMRYALRSKNGQIKVKVPYWNAGAYSVSVNDVKIPQTPWDNKIGSPAELTGNKGCGENRFVGVKNFLEFILTPGCELYVNPVDAITANVRMSWTLNQFYASGGVVSFADRVAAALGIQSYQIKTVAVYTGSVVVEYQITTATGDTNPTSTLINLQYNLNQLVTSNSTAFGAPILSASTNGKSVVTDPNYKPPVNTNTPQNPTTNAFIAPIQATQQTSQQVTVQATSLTSNQADVDVGQKSNSNLLIILLVLVLVFVCCFGCGTAIFCIMRKKALNQAAVKKQTGQDINANRGVVVSEAELNPQFHPNQDFDVDIFSNKKRVLKMNEDFTDIGNTNNIPVSGNTSEQKLVKYSDDGQQEIQNQN